MDSLTQLSLGAVVGESLIGRKAGHKAWLWGAFLGTLPDLDVIAYAFMDIVPFTEFHRGPSHSITLHIPLAILFAYLLPYLHPQTRLSRFQWGSFAFLVLFTHALLDCFTTWGTKLFWPFGGRIAWETIFVIDPIYTLGLLIPLVGAIILHRKEQKRWRWIRTALLISSTYLLLTVLIKGYVNETFKHALHQEAMAQKDLKVESFRTHPTPMNSLLWSSIARTGDGDYLLAYHSILAPARPIEFRRIDGEHELLEELRSFEKVRSLIEISQGFYSVEKDKDGGYRFYDLRFGELFFWEPGRAKPVFLYRIHPRSEGAPRIERKEGATGLKEGDMSAFLQCILNGVPMQESEGS